MASSARSLFAYDSDSDTALDAVRRENVLASQNILAAAMDASVSKFPFLHGGNSSSAQGVIRMSDMSPAEFATFVDGTIYRDFADLATKLDLNERHHRLQDLGLVCGGKLSQRMEEGAGYM